jgi:hypothetical protein
LLATAVVREDTAVFREDTSHGSGRHEPCRQRSL